MQATSTRGGVPLGQPSAMSGNSFTSFLSGKTSRPHPERNKKDYWWEPRVFRAEEQRRADVNRMAASQRKVFISHCWLKKNKNKDGPDDESDPQRKKRQMISYLSIPAKDGGAGLAYYADFLDLLAEGPVPWCREIEEGINASSKVVCFVDEAWLTSFNCLQELAYAIREDKPVVVLILDQEAWELLTVPGGTKRAWSLHKWGPALKEYADQEILPEVKFSVEKLDELFSYLSGINLCPCRQLEEKNFGVQGMMENMQKYVSKDLIYFKQHAELKEYARKWEASGNRSSLLLHRAEAEKWSQWVDSADEMRAMPPPTAIQRRFVSASMKQAASLVLRLKIAAILLLVLLLCGAVASGVMAVVAGQESAKARAATSQAEDALLAAEDAAFKAQEALRKAEEAEADAQIRKLVATQERDKARRENDVSISALLQSVVAPFVKDPVMLASEVRMYIKASSLLEEAGGSFLEQQLLPELSERFSNPLWISQPPLTGLSGNITCGALSPVSPGLLAVGSRDGIVRIWDTATGRTTLSLSGHSGPVLALIWSPFEATRLISGSSDATIIEWDISPSLDHPVRFQSSPGSGAVTSLAWSPVNPGKVASGSDDNLVLVWSLGNKGSRELLGHTGPVTDIQWHPTSEAYLASASVDGTARIWDMTTINKAAVLEHNATVRAVAFSVADNGAKLATGSDDGAVNVWNTADGTAIATLGHHTHPVTSLSWDKFDTAGMGAYRVASISRIGEVKGWNFQLGDTVAVDTLWPLSYGNSATAANNIDPSTLSWSSYILDNVDWSEFNSSTVSRAWVLRNSDTTVAQAWKLSSGHRTSISIHTARDVPITCMAFESSSCPSRRMATGTEDGEVIVYSFQSITHSVIYTHSSRPTALAWSSTACGTLVMSFADTSIRLWRDGWGEVQTLVQAATSVSYLSFSPQGTKVAYNVWDGSVGSIRYYDFDAGRSELMDQMASPPGEIAWSPIDQGLLAAAASADVKVWDLSGPSITVKTLAGHSLQVECVAWSPIERNVLASGAYDNTVSVWDVSDGSRTPLVGHQGSVTSISWSPDGRYLASSSRVETTIRVWDTSTYLVRVLQAGGSRETIAHVGFTPFPGVMVSSSSDTSVIKIWQHMDRRIGQWVIFLNNFHDGVSNLTNSDLLQYGLSETILTTT